MTKVIDDKLTEEEYDAWLEYMTSQCYACATQRDKCEHDDINWEEYQKGKSWEDEAPRKEEFEDGI